MENVNGSLEVKNEHSRSHKLTCSITLTELFILHQDEEQKCQTYFCHSSGKLKPQRPMTDLQNECLK